MAVAAFLDHLGLEVRHGVLLDAVCGVTVVASGRGQVAFVPHFAVLARCELRPFLLVTAPAGIRNARPGGGAVRIGFRADRMGAMAVRAGRRGTRRGARQRLAVNAVVELGDDVAARQLGARHHRIIAVTLAARGFEVRVIGARCGILGAPDVVDAVTIRARRGNIVAALARQAMHGPAVILDFLRWQFAQSTCLAFRDAAASGRRRRRGSRCI